MVQKKAFLNIYVSSYPFECGSQNISFAPRAEEIEACTNENVRRQKLYVWKLLELAVGDLSGMDLNSLNLRKDENGKWQSDKIYISLSHSGNVVAAAVSDSSVGLDIEFFNEKKFGKSLANRIATESEKSFLQKSVLFRSECAPCGRGKKANLSVKEKKFSDRFLQARFRRRAGHFCSNVIMKAMFCQFREKAFQNRHLSRLLIMSLSSKK